MGEERPVPLPQRSTLYQKGQWLVCVLPPLVVIGVEETPGLSGLNGINAAALIVLSPLVLVLGFGLTAAIVMLTRGISRKAAWQSRVGRTLLMLVIVGVLSPIAYLDQDWLLLGAIELGSLPAAILLTLSHPPVG